MKAGIKKVFTYDRYGEQVQFTIGQKVRCIYYNEYTFIQPEAYRRGWLQMILDKPFKPVKHGIIISDAGVHPYWLARNGKTEQYLFVKFKEY